MPKFININSVGDASDPHTIENSPFYVSVHSSENFEGNIILERKKTGEAVSLYRRVKDYSFEEEDNGYSSGEWQYRLRCSQLKSGTIVAEVGP